MRVPLSWLRDFAPFVGEPAELAATLDDLGLVVEEIELVNEGLGDVVVASVESIAPIEGADKIRKVLVDAGSGPVEVVCGAWNFEEGDLVPLAPVGSVLPGGFEIGRRKMKGVVSNGMLCSGRELKLSDDHEGILVLNAVEGASRGRALTDVLELEPDVVFDIAVEANRPDAWCIAGVARDLAARLRLPFAIPDTPSLPPVRAGRGTGTAPSLERTDDPAVGALATAQVDDLDLCPRFTCRVITGVVPGPSPRWLAQRLTLAGMRPINNVVDASNYVMLELGQPTHPYDLDRLPGNGLLVRRARPGETVVTLDGVERTLGLPGPGFGDAGQDCLICDAEGTPVGIGGVMGGASSEIDDSTSRVLLEAAYFDPMTIARTSKRLGLRTEASARFERGCDPTGIDRAAVRFCELLGLTAGQGMAVADGVIDIVGEVPRPVEMVVRPAQINELLGTELTTEAMVGLLGPLGIDATPVGPESANGGGPDLAVTVPTFRPDIRPAPIGESDIAEEIARTFGYSRIRRRTPAWPQPGRLSTFQSERRLLKKVLCGIGCDEVWTAAFVSEVDQTIAGFEPPYVEVSNPLVESERFLRSSMAPGLVRTIIYNAERRQGDVRLFEVGSVFRAEATDADQAGGQGADLGAVTSERLSAVFAAEGDDAWAAVAAWRTIADAFRIADWELGSISDLGAVGAVLHPTRSASVLSTGATVVGGNGQSRAVVIGAVGELEPSAVARLGLVNSDGRPRRVGWIDLDVGVLLDRDRVARRPDQAVPITRFPSSDIDLAFVVEESVPAGRVERTLRQAGGELLESVALFDVFRAASVGERSRSLAFRLRFSSLDRTLTDQEVGDLRSACIDAVVSEHGARLR